MSYSCGIVKDLLPLYLDKVCSEESKTAVEEHLSECEGCRRYYETIKTDNTFSENPKDKLEGLKMADSLKKVKRRLNKRVAVTIGCSLAVIAVYFLGFQLLFNLPVKEIDLSDISVSAKVYATDELEMLHEHGADSVTLSQSGDSEVKISSGSKDHSEVLQVTIPELNNAQISLTKDTLDKSGCLSVISWSSPYFLKEIKWADKEDGESDVLYVSNFKTTLLNNKAEDYQQTMTSLEMKKISKIVYLSDNGTEKVLWENDRQG